MNFSKHNFHVSKILKVHFLTIACFFIMYFTVLYYSCIQFSIFSFIKVPNSISFSYNFLKVFHRYCWSFSVFLLIILEILNKMKNVLSRHLFEERNTNQIVGKASRRCSTKSMFLKNLENSQENSSFRAF